MLRYKERGDAVERAKVDKVREKMLHVKYEMQQQIQVKEAQR